MVQVQLRRKSNVAPRRDSDDLGFGADVAHCDSLLDPVCEAEGRLGRGGRDEDCRGAVSVVGTCYPVLAPKGGPEQGPVEHGHVFGEGAGVVLGVKCASDNLVVRSAIYVLWCEKSEKETPINNQNHKTSLHGPISTMDVNGQGRANPLN